MKEAEVKMGKKQVSGEKQDAKIAEEGEFMGHISSFLQRFFTLVFRPVMMMMIIISNLTNMYSVKVNTPKRNPPQQQLHYVELWNQ